jgi:hypothetical protein
VARHCETGQSSAFAYFFFGGRDSQKGQQTVASLIRSLIRQFSATYGGVPTVLTELYHSCQDGGSQPSVESLQTTLLLILEVFDDVFIVLDALDECAERKDILGWVKKMTSWSKGKLHLLATSRVEEEIANHLRLLDPNYVDIEQDLVGRDVKIYVDYILNGEDAFDRWDDEIKANIKNTVLESAGGMFVPSNIPNDDNLTVFYSRFPLVSLQISELKDCPNEEELEGRLQHLSHNLDEVYDRIISGLGRRRDDALTILQWLSFSARPLTLAELAQVTGVVHDADQGLRFEPSRVLPDPRSVLTICSSLVTEINGLCLK